MMIKLPHSAHAQQGSPDAGAQATALHPLLTSLVRLLARAAAKACSLVASQVREGAIHAAR